jgi:hypothetical protein
VLNKYLIQFGTCIFIYSLEWTTGTWAVGNEPGAYPGIFRGVQNLYFICSPIIIIV